MTANRLPCVAASSLHGLERERESLDRADDDLLALRQRSSELPALAAAFALDGDDDALRAFEVEERILQLPVDHVAVGNDDDRREQLLVLGVVKVGEEMRGPGDRIGFARSGRMLNEVFAARAFLAHGGDAAFAWRRAGDSGGR